MLYDYLCTGRTQPPVVLDAEDLVHNTTATISKLCKQLDLDEDGVRQTWEPESTNERDITGDDWVMKLQYSRGIIRDEKRLPDGYLDLGVSMRDYVQEIGQDVASTLRGMVEGEMEAYLYLRRRKL